MADKHPAKEKTKQAKQKKEPAVRSTVYPDKPLTINDWFRYIHRAAADPEKIHCQP